MHCSSTSSETYFFKVSAPDGILRTGIIPVAIDNLSPRNGLRKRKFHKKNKKKKKDSFDITVSFENGGSMLVKNLPCDTKASDLCMRIRDILHLRHDELYSIYIKVSIEVF